MITLLLACAARSVDQEPAPTVAPPVDADQTLEGVELGITGLGPCRRFVMSINDYGDRGDVVVERDPDSERVGCSARVDWLGWPSGWASLEIDPNGSSVASELYGASWIKHQQVLLQDPTGDLGWVIDAGRLERTRPPTALPDPYGRVSLVDRFFVVFEVTVQGKRPDDVSPLHPTTAVSPEESWRRGDRRYCTEYVRPHVFRAADLSLLDRLASSAHAVEDLRVWCSRTHGNVFAVELRGLERQPIDVRLDIANAPRLVRLHVSPSDTLAIVDITVEPGID